MRSLACLLAVFLIVVSCQKSENEYTLPVFTSMPIEEKEQVGSSGYIDIDARILIGNPSYAEVTSTAEFNTNKDPEEAYTFKTISIVNHNGSVLTLEGKKHYPYYAEIDFSSGSEFSKTDSFQMLIEFENGDMIESEFVTSSDNVIEISSVPAEEAIKGNSLDFGIEMKFENSKETRLKWDISSAYKITNYDLVKINDGCDKWEDICAEVKNDIPPFNIAKADCDGDGVSNAVECDNGTDPRNSEDGGDLQGIKYFCYFTEHRESGYQFFTKFGEDVLSAYQTLHSRDVDFAFSEQYVVEANVQSISEPYYTYLYNMYGESGVKDPFERRAAFGNLTNISSKRQQVRGFFHVSSYNKLLYKSTIDPTGKSLPICIDEEDENFYKHICTDCVTAPRVGGVSFFRPSFWPN